MSRFDMDGDWDYGRWSLWEQATVRAFEGDRAQHALASLEEALLALPHRRLIEGAVATREGEVCAIGALVLHKRVQAGESREVVLNDLACKVDPEESWGGEAADTTAILGRTYGDMAYAMAWRIAELNDEDLRGRSPEERFDFVLAFVRRAQGKTVEVTAP